MPIKAFDDINSSLDDIKQAMLDISVQESKTMASISNASKSIRANYDISRTSISALSPSISKISMATSGYSDMQSRLNLAVLEGTKLTMNDINSRTKLKAMVESTSAGIGMESKRRDDILKQAGIVEKANYALVEGVEGVKDAYVGSNTEMFKSSIHIGSFTSGIQNAVSMTANMSKEINQQVVSLENEIKARADHVRELEREMNAANKQLTNLGLERIATEKRIGQIKTGSREFKILQDRLVEIDKRTVTLKGTTEDYNKAINEQAALSTKAAGKVSDLKNKIPDLISNFLKASVAAAVLVVAFKLAAAAQDALRSSMIETGMVAGEQDRLISDLRITQSTYNLSLEEASDQYGALAKQAMFAVTPTGMLDKRMKDMIGTNIKLSKVFGVSADEAAEFQRNLQRLGMGGQIEGVGSAMLLAAKKTGMTNQEVFQLAKGFEGLGVYVEQRFRQKAIASFLAVGASIRDMGGDAQDVASLTKDMLNITSSRGQAAKAILGRSVEGGVATLDKAIKSGDFGKIQDAMMKPLKGLNAAQFSMWKISYGDILGISEQTMEALYKNANATDAELKRVKKNLDMQKELEISSKSARGLNESFATTMETASRGFNRLKLAGGALLARIGEPLAKVLGVVADALGFTAEKIADLINWMSKSSPIVKYAIDGIILLTAAFYGLKAAAFIFGKTFLVSMGPIGWAIMGIVVAAALIIKYWEPIKGFFVDTFNDIYYALEPVFDFFTELWNTLVDWSGVIAIFAPFIGIPLLIFKNWSAIKGFFVNLFTGIWKVVKWWYGGIWDGIKMVFGWITKYISWSVGLWVKVFKTVADVVKAPFMAVYNWVKDMFGKMVGLMMGPINAIIKKIPNFLLPAGLKKYKDELNKPITPKVTLPSAQGSAGRGSAIIVKKLQEGGLVQRPMLASIGEAGPEAVIPLSASADNPLLKPLSDLVEKLGATMGKREEKMQVDNSDVIGAITSLQRVLEKYMAFQTDADRVPPGMEPNFGWNK